MRAAAVQLNSGPDPAANLAAADRHARAAAADGAELVVLPEKWNVLGTPEHLRAGAEPLDGPAVTWMRSTAAELPAPNGQPRHRGESAWPGSSSGEDAGDGR